MCGNTALGRGSTALGGGSIAWVGKEAEREDTALGGEEVRGTALGGEGAFLSRTEVSHCVQAMHSVPSVSQDRVRYMDECTQMCKVMYWPRSSGHSRPTGVVQ